MGRNPDFREILVIFGSFGLSYTVLLGYYYFCIYLGF